MDNDRIEPNSNSMKSNSVGKDPLPLDPSNTNNIGQKVEQGVVDTEKGISEQSSEWEDKQERTKNDISGNRAENI